MSQCAQAEEEGTESPMPTTTMSVRKSIEPRGLSHVLPRSLIQLVIGLKAHG